VGPPGDDYCDCENEMRAMIDNKFEEEIYSDLI
jgi:hypothetical protein